jgi:WD40 repeat protein
MLEALSRRLVSCLSEPNRTSFPRRSLAAIECSIPPVCAAVLVLSLGLLPASAADTPHPPANAAPRFVRSFGVPLGPPSGGGNPQIAFSRDSRLLAYGGPLTTIIWDLRRQTEVCTLRYGDTRSVYQMAFSPDSKQFLMAGTEIRFWDLGKGEVVRTSGWLEPAVVSLAFSPDGKRGVAAVHDEVGTVRVWDFASGKVEREFRAVADLVTSVGFDAAGKCFAVGRINGKEYGYYDLEGHKRLFTFGPAWLSMVVRLNGDCTRLLTCPLVEERRSKTRLWDTAAGKCLATLERRVEGACFVPGQTEIILATGAAVQAWSPMKDRILWSLEQKDFRRKQRYELGSVEVSPDGRWLAFLVNGREGETVELWELPERTVKP